MNEYYVVSLRKTCQIIKIWIFNVEKKPLSDENYYGKYLIFTINLNSELSFFKIVFMYTIWGYPRNNLYLQ